VLKQYNAILSEDDEPSSTKAHQSKGYLKIHFAYKYHFSGVMPRPLLIITPIEKQGAEISIYLSKNDNGRTLGPFPAGQYTVSLVTTATAGIPDKKYVPVSIGKNKTEELDFVFTPDGLVSGCVTDSRESKYTAGMPEYIYRSGNSKIIISSISIKGNGIDRSLQPVRGEYYNNNEYLLSYSDFCYNECFGFFGLPAGDFSVSIKAEGYKPIKKNVTVIPGTPKSFQNIELTSE
jgi:hypothetical protein